MKPEEEAQLIEKLGKQFVLIPKDKMYHCIGGAVAFVVLALGINLGSVVAYMHSLPAKTAEDNIMQISNEVARCYANVQQYCTNLQAFCSMTNEIVKINKPYKIHTESTDRGRQRTFGLFVEDGALGNGARANIAEGRGLKWKLVPE